MQNMPPKAVSSTEYIPVVHSTVQSSTPLSSMPCIPPNVIGANRNILHNSTPIMATQPHINNSGSKSYTGLSVQSSNVSVISNPISPMTAIGYKDIMQPVDPKGFSFKDRIMNFYSAYCPPKMSRVDDLLTKYKGNEQGVIDGLVMKYGPEPPMMVPHKVPVFGTPTPHRFVSQPSVQIPVTLQQPNSLFNKVQTPLNSSHASVLPIPDSPADTNNTAQPPKCIPKSPKSVKKGPPPGALMKRKSKTTRDKLATSLVTSDSTNTGVITADCRDGDYLPSHQEDSPQQRGAKFPIEKENISVGHSSQITNSPVISNTLDTSFAATPNDIAAPVTNRLDTSTDIQLKTTEMSHNMTSHQAAVGKPGAKLALLLSKLKASSDSDSDSTEEIGSETLPIGKSDHICLIKDDLNKEGEEENGVPPDAVLLNNESSELMKSVVNEGRDKNEDKYKVRHNTSSSSSDSCSTLGDDKATVKQQMETIMEVIPSSSLPHSDAEKEVRTVESEPNDNILIDKPKSSLSDGDDKDVHDADLSAATGANRTSTPEKSSLDIKEHIEPLHAVVNRKLVIDVESTDNGKKDATLMSPRQNWRTKSPITSKSTNKLTVDLKHRSVTVTVTKSKTSSRLVSGEITPDQKRVSPLVIPRGSSDRLTSLLLDTASTVAKDVMAPLRPYKSPYRRLQRQHDEALAAHMIATGSADRIKPSCQRKLLAQSPIARSPTELLSTTKPTDSVMNSQIHGQGRNISAYRRSPSLREKERCFPEKGSKSVTIDYERNNMVIVDRRYFSPNIERPPQIDSVFGVPQDKVKGAMIGRSGGHGSMLSPSREVHDDRRRCSSVPYNKGNSSRRSSTDRHGPKGQTLKERALLENRTIVKTNVVSREGHYSGGHFMACDDAYTRNYVNTFHVKDPNLPSVWAAPRLKESILREIQDDITKGALDKITAFHPLEANLESTTLSCRDENHSNEVGKSTTGDLKSSNTCSLKNPTKVTHNWRNGEIVIKSPLDTVTGLQATTTIQTRSGLGSLRAAAYTDINKECCNNNNNKDGEDSISLSNRTKGLRVVRIIKKVPIGEEALKQQEMTAKRLSKPKAIYVAHNTPIE